MSTENEIAIAQHAQNNIVIAGDHNTVQQFIQYVKKELTRYPYKFLSAYDLADRDIFFGRNAVIEELVATIPRHKVLLINGASGAGKSSLLNAGVIPHLTEQGYRFLTIRDYTDPLQQLRAEFIRQQWLAAPAAETGSLTQMLRTLHQQSITLLLVFDQFEQFFLQVPYATRQAFLQEFKVCLGSLSVDKMNVVFAIRRDFLGQMLAEFEQVISTSFSQESKRLDLYPLSKAEAREAIMNPLKHLAVKIGYDKSFVEDILLTRLLEQTSDQVGIEPPHLQIVCNQLYETAHRRLSAEIDMVQINAALYDELGGVEKILQTYLDEVVKEITADKPAKIAVIRSLLKAMIETSGTRRFISVADLQRALPDVDGADIERFLGQLQDRRVLETRQREGEWQFSLSHEIMVAQVASWYDEREWERKRAEETLERGLKEWASSKTLLNEKQFSHIRQWLPQVDETAEALLVESEAAVAEQKRKEKRQSRLKQALVSLVFIAAIVAMWFAYRASENEKVATAQKVVAQQERDNALRGQSLFMADLARQQLEKSNSATAMRLALEALPGTSSDNSQRPFVSEVQDQLYAAVEQHWRGVWEHDGQVNYVEFSPDGKMVLTATGNFDEPFGNNAYLWEFPSGNLLKVFRGHTQAVQSAHFTPDAKRVLTVSYDGTARLWDIESGQPLRVFRNKRLAFRFAPGFIFSPTIAAFSPNGKLLAMTIPELDRRDKNENDQVWKDDKQVERKKRYEVNLWDVETGQEVAVLWGEVAISWLTGGRDRDTTKIFTIRFSPDGKQLVIALADDTVRVLDIETGREVAVLKHEGKWDNTSYTIGVIHAIFSPDGKRVLSIGRDRTIRLWDIKTSKQLTILHGPSEGTWSATFSPDGKKIATASLDKTARLWDTSSGKELAVLTGHRGSLHYIAFSPDGNRLVTTSLGGKANSEGEVAKLWSSDGQSSVVLHGHQGEVRHAAFSPDGKWLITASSDKTTRVWNVLTGQQPSVISNINNGATFNRDGTRIFTEHSNGDTGYLWKNDGQQLAILKGSNAVFSNDSGKILVYDNRYCQSDNCYYDYDAVYLYDAKDGKELAKLNSEKRRVFMALSYDKNGQRLIELRDAAKNIRVFNVQFSPKGKFIVAISYLNVRIWDSSTGQELAVLPLFIDVTGRGYFPCMNWDRLALVGKNNCVTFSPDERLIAVADGDNTVGIWDTSNGQKMSTLVVVDRSLRFEFESIWSIAFSPDGTKIITASNSETHNARLWDIATGKELLTFSGHEDAIEDVAFSPDGKLVLTGSRDGTARVWDAKTAKEIAVLSGHDGFVRQVSFSENGEKIFTRSVVNADSSMKFTRKRVFDAKTFKLLTLSEPLILDQHRNEIQAVLHSYGQEYEGIGSPLGLDETTLITSNEAMLVPVGNDKTLYWLPIFSGLDSLMSYTRKFLSRHEWTCEERRRFFLEVSRCPEQKLQEGQSPEHATYLRFAEVGDAKMQYVVATDYLEGADVVKDVEEGVKWLHKAAEQGHAAAQAALAASYYQGKDVPQNYKESAKWALKAAEQGQAGAQGLLCSMLVMYQTHGIEQNDQEAFKWCSQAAMEVGGEAFSLGILYRDGRGVKQNLKEAAKWFQRFLQAGHDSKQQVAWLHHLVEVISVSPNSQAERLGLKVGDTFTHYDGHPVFNANFFVSEHDAEPKMSLPKELKVLRGSQELVFQIPPGKLGIELKDVDK